MIIPAMRRIRFAAAAVTAAGIASLAPAQTAGTDDVPEAGAVEEGARSGTDVELFDLEGRAGATGEVLEAEAEADRALRAGLVRVGDLKGRTVLGQGDETIGKIDRIVRFDGRFWAVLEEGGILGIGDDEIPIAIDRLLLTPDLELRAEGLTEEMVEAAGDADLSGAEDLPPDMPLTDLTP